MQTMKHLGWILVGAAVGVLVACSGSSSADTGLTQSQVQTMITAAVSPLQQQIAALQSQVQTLQASTGSVARVFITAPNASAATALLNRCWIVCCGRPSSAAAFTTFPQRATVSTASCICSRVRACCVIQRTSRAFQCEIAARGCPARAPPPRQQAQSLRALRLRG